MTEFLVYLSYRSSITVVSCSLNNALNTASFDSFSKCYPGDQTSRCRPLSSARRTRARERKKTDLQVTTYYHKVIEWMSFWHILSGLSRYLLLPDGVWIFGKNSKRIKKVWGVGGAKSISDVSRPFTIFRYGFY